jgi:hypothetical protein
MFKSFEEAGHGIESHGVQQYKFDLFKALTMVTCVTLGLDHVSAHGWPIFCHMDYQKFDTCHHEPLPLVMT